MLILQSRSEPGGFGRLIVNVKTKALRDKVIYLLEKDLGKQAFDLLIRNAEIEAYLAPGQDPSVKPFLTLAEEDMG